jgi:tetratricopeptide (TPR) repeat protein
VPALVADLPAVRSAPAAPPPPGGFGFGEIDLPALGHQGDLPASSAGVGLPALSGGVGLPASSGGLGLPALQDNFPASSGAGLPMAVHGAALPMPVDGQGLPSPIGGAGLPMAMPGGNLPANVAGGGLPMAVHGGGLPMAVHGGGLPMAVQGGALPANVAGGGLPMAVQGGGLPANVAGGGLPMAVHGGGLPMAVHGGGLPAVPSGDGPVNFGEFELPADPSLSTAAPQIPAGGHDARVGGMAFGEVDLGGGMGADEAPIAPPVAISGTSMEADVAPGEAQLHQGGRAERRHSIEARPSSKAPKIIAGVVALFIIGGAALQFTPVGAFGHLVISDAVRKGEYLKTAQTSAEAARKKQGADTWGAARAANDELAEARKKYPRARPLTAMAAFSELAAQVRFGADIERGSRAKLWLAEIPPNTDVQYHVAALAAQDALSGDPVKARKSIDNARAKVGADPITTDLDLLRGEVELSAKDAAAAKAAFARASSPAAGVRATFGLARAAYLARDLEGAKKSVDAVLAQSPNHPGALTLRARVSWELSQADEAALKDLAVVLDGPGKALASSHEMSEAYAAKGWVLLGRDRAGEARAAFQEAVKLDGKNISALIGQGEILLADGRYAEALTRFDEAIAKDPKSLDAIIGSAKTKIQLERLQEVKTQLAGASVAFPKNMRVSLWLGRTEEALGNKQVAEQHYNTAIELSDPKQVESVQAYAALASLLASEGRASEAQAKLELARQKLPPSSALERALGEVAAAQGHYDEAISHLETALTKDSKDVGTRFRLAVTLRKMRKYTEAEAEFDKVTALDKEYPGLAVERGLLFEESGQVEKALDQFKSALAKAPNDIDLKLRVGAAYAANGNVDEAIPMIKNVLQTRANSAEAEHFLGRAYLKKGGLDTVTAMKHLKRAVELDPNRAEYHLYVAWAANESVPADLGLAKTHVDKALALDKLNADAYWQRGVVYRRQSSIDFAIRDLLRALELKPARYEAHAMLAECYGEKNNGAAALAEWGKAIAGDEKRPEWRYRYGRLLADKGNAKDAYVHLKYATEEGSAIQPRPGWFAQAQFEAGEASKKTGRKAEAIEHYKFFLQLAPPTDPDRRDAIKALKELGASHEE